MAFNIEMISEVYQKIQSKVDKARTIKQTPLTLSRIVI